MAMGANPIRSHAPASSDLPSEMLRSGPTAKPSHAKFAHAATVRLIEEVPSLPIASMYPKGSNDAIVSATTS